MADQTILYNLMALAKATDKVAIDECMLVTSDFFPRPHCTVKLTGIRCYL